MSATARATDTHSPTQSHMCMGCVQDTRHERHARQTQIHTFHNMAPYPQVRTRLAHTPHAHTPTHARMYVCTYTHLSTHTVARMHARRTCSWRLCHAPAWRSPPPARPPSVWPCTSRWRRPTHEGSCPHSRWPAVGRQGSTRLSRQRPSAPEGQGQGRQGSGGREG